MTRIFAFVLGLMLVLAPLPAPAQVSTETLADIRLQLSELAAQLTGLRQELVATGASGGAAGGASALERMDAIEAELVRLTSKSEELENRISRVVADGTNRLGDLEFRLTELEGGDPGALPPTPTLGGTETTGDAPALTTEPAADADPGTGGGDLAVNEQADFDRAKAALDSGDFRGAADFFATFTQSYTGGPLSGEAHFLRGEALAGLGDTEGAARSYLESFSGAPNGTRAADALLKLGLSLNQLGQPQEACVTLGEVGTRFPGSLAAGQASEQMASLGCS